MPDSMQSRWDEADEVYSRSVADAQAASAQFEADYAAQTAANQHKLSKELARRILAVRNGDVTFDLRCQYCKSTAIREEMNDEGEMLIGGALECLQCGRSSLRMAIHADRRNRIREYLSTGVAK